MPQFSQSGRVVSLVKVQQGDVYYLTPGDTTWTAATNNTGDDPPLNFSGVMASAANVEKLWFADGVNWVYYDARENSVERWSPSAGALPVDSLNNKPRLICTWRGRTVLSGLLLDPANWFMSRVNDPTDFDYGPENPDPTQAIAGNNGPQGLVGDAVTALIPYSDDVLIFGCDSSIFMMQGDPMAGGQIDRVTDAIGMAWDRAWAKDPYGVVYFVSNKTGIYTLIPGQKPQRISQPVEAFLQNIDTGQYVIRVGYNDRDQSMHFFFTYAAEPLATTHLVYELRSGSWFTEVFANTDHNPICLTTFDGNLPGDRVMLLGAWDGYVRAFDPDADDDDGTAIASEVVLGPLLTKDFDEVMLKDLQAILGNDSGEVEYAVHAGATAELALAANPVATGAWSAGRNLLSPVRAAAHALYVKLSSTERWAMEQIRARMATTGRVRGRGY